MVDTVVEYEEGKVKSNERAASLFFLPLLCWKLTRVFILNNILQIRGHQIGYPEQVALYWSFPQAPYTVISLDKVVDTNKGR
jgi:hypothetical protein